MTSVTETVQGPLKSSQLFFVLSGEHETLPGAEVEAILDSAGFVFGNPKRSYRLLTLEAPPQALSVVSERSLMFDSCGVVLGACEAEESEIHHLVRNLPIEEQIGDSESFAVRSARLGGTHKQLRRVDLERDIGSTIKEMVPRLKVQLTHPDITLMCILFENSVLFGISGFSKPSGLIAPRLPRKRPVFHPSTMPPKIARCMVNLARARPKAIFTDPFSGVGGITLEAAMIGCDVVALDANLRMVRGVRRNLKHFGLGPLGLVNGDARSMPLQGVDAIATDPPYGRGSSTLGVKMTHLVRDFLLRVGDSLKAGSHVCISAPEQIQVEDYAKEAGLTFKERHIARVHRSLTRQFVVLRNK